jgi:hypothetical protein
MNQIPEDKRIELETTIFFRRPSADRGNSAEAAPAQIVRPSEPVIKTDRTVRRDETEREFLIPI